MNLEKVFSFDDDIFPWVVERVKRTFRKKDVLPGTVSLSILPSQGRQRDIGPPQIDY